MKDFFIAHYFLLRWIPGQAIEVALALRQGRTYLLVTPQGFEPVIADLRGRLPKPLEDGAIRALAGANHFADSQITTADLSGLLTFFR